MQLNLMIDRGQSRLSDTEVTNSGYGGFTVCLSLLSLSSVCIAFVSYTDLTLRAWGHVILPGSIANLLSVFENRVASGT